MNMGTGVSHKISEIAEAIKKECEYAGQIIYNPSRFVGVGKRLLDITLIKEKLGWSAKTSMKEGIRNTVNWYKNFIGERNNAE